MKIIDVCNPLAVYRNNQVVDPHAREAGRAFGIHGKNFYRLISG